jgi:hypothetical protein
MDGNCAEVDIADNGPGIVFWARLPIHDQQ